MSIRPNATCTCCHEKITAPFPPSFWGTTVCDVCFECLLIVVQMRRGDRSTKNSLAIALAFASHGKQITAETLGRTADNAAGKKGGDS